MPGCRVRPAWLTQVPCASLMPAVSGPHVGSSAGGLCQCCQLMGLPVSALFTALQQQQQQHMHAGGGGSSSSSEWRIAAACCRPELQACCSNTLGASSASSTRSSSSRQQGQAQGEDKLAAATSPLGCCCQDSASMPADGRPQQWACGAAAHRQHCSRLAAGGACAAATPGGSHTLHTDTLMSAEVRAHHPTCNVCNQWSFSGLQLATGQPSASREAHGGVRGAVDAAA